MTTLKTTRRASPRPGFTLIELLVVVTIIAVLLGLVSAAVVRVMAGQQVSAAEYTLKKLHSEYDRQEKAVIDDAANEFAKGAVHANLMTVAGGNPDNAKKLWIRLRLRQEFPNTFQEAKAGFDYPPLPAPTRITMPPKGIYVSKLAPPMPASASADFEASVCLVMALSQARRGEVSHLEEAVGPSMFRTVDNGRVVVDPWDKFIVFRAGTNEANLGTPIHAVPDITSAGGDKVHSTSDDIHSATMRQVGARGDQP